MILLFFLQAQSQTEWITVYKIYPTEDSLLDFTLNIIDTPGFGDTRGIKRDNAIVQQIHDLFSAQGEQGVIDIDAVCFIAKAPDARLTATQTYIFTSIMALFGKDIAANICTLITFADGATPAVLASLKESKLPFGETFTFNNSALFAENESSLNNSLSPMFWKMGYTSFERFFKYICKLETKSLFLTKNVLDERNQLKTIISNILPQVKIGLSKITILKKEKEMVQRHEDDIEHNRNFSETLPKTEPNAIKLKPGVYITNCLDCKITCHKDCKITYDADKLSCAVMDRDTGKCTVCPGHCDWKRHRNSDYYLEFVTKMVTITSESMKKAFEAATGRKFTSERFIEQNKMEVESQLHDIKCMMEKVNMCRKRLDEIALTADPLTSEEYIDLLIASEKREHKDGFEERIVLLEEMKSLTNVDKHYEDLVEKITNM